jgi:hypothetical protein
MPVEQPFRPDADYCVYCHAEAAGSCASCRAIVCGDCASLVTASGRSFAVCKDCEKKTSLARAWASLLWPVALLLAVGALVLWAVR